MNRRRSSGAITPRFPGATRLPNAPASCAAVVSPHGRRTGATARRAGTLPSNGTRKTVTAAKTHTGSAFPKTAPRSAVPALRTKATNATTATTAAAQGISVFAAVRRFADGRPSLAGGLE